MNGPTLISAGTVLGLIVGPALDAVLLDDEFDDLHLVRTQFDARVEYELALVAKGEQFKAVVYDSSAAYPPGGPSEVLRGYLVDFVAESRFGWGQNRDVPR